MIINLFSNQYAIGMDDPFSQPLSHGNVRDQESCDLLPPDFEPGKWDVICQRGKECFDHVGNRRFRMCIDSHLDQYMKVKSRQQKSKIVTSIVQSIRSAAALSGGGFVRKDLLTRRWFKVGDKLAREKVGQALRDAIKTRRASGGKPSPEELDDDSLRSAGKKRSGEDAGLFSKFDNEDDDDDTTKPAKKAFLSNPSLNNPQSGVVGLSQHFPDEGSASLMIGHRNALQAALQASTADDLLFGGQLQLPQQQQQPQKKPTNTLRFDNQLEAELEPTPIQNQTRMLPDLIDRRRLVANTFNLNQYASSTSSNQQQQQQLLRLQTEIEDLQSAIGGGSSSSTGGFPASLNALIQSDVGSWNIPTNTTNSSYEQHMLQSVIQSRRMSLSLSGSNPTTAMDLFQGNRSSLFASQFKVSDAGQEAGQGATTAASSNNNTNNNDGTTITDWEEVAGNYGSQLFKF